MLVMFLWRGGFVGGVCGVGGLWILFRLFVRVGDFRCLGIGSVCVSRC